MTAFSKEYIEQVTESLIHSTPEEVIAFGQVLESHPHGKEFSGAILKSMFGRLLKEVDGFFSASEEVTEEYCGDTCGCYDEDDYEDQTNVAGVSGLVSQQISQQNLSKQIRSEVNKQNLSKSIAAQTKSVEEPVVDLHMFIKKQVDGQNLSKTIAQQLANGSTEQAATVEEEVSLDEVVTSILNDIVVEVIEKRLVQDSFDLNSLAIDLYEIVFFNLFEAGLEAKGLAGRVEYNSDYTAYIMAGIAGKLVEQGFGLSFKVVQSEVVPTLSAN